MIVGIDAQLDPGVVQLTNRVRCITFDPSLPGTGFHIAGQADFHWDLPVDTCLHHVRMRGHAPPMPDSIHTQLQPSCDIGDRVGSFPRMHSDRNMVCLAQLNGFLVQVQRPRTFVPGNVEPTHFAVGGTMGVNGQLRHVDGMLGVVGPEGTHDDTTGIRYALRHRIHGFPRCQLFIGVKSGAKPQFYPMHVVVLFGLGTNHGRGLREFLTGLKELIAPIKNAPVLIFLLSIGMVGRASLGFQIVEILP